MNNQDYRMKRFGMGLLSAGVLAMLLGAGTTAKAQEGHEDAKPQQEEPKKDEAKPQQKEQPRDMKPQHEQSPARAEEGKQMRDEKEDRAQENRGHEAHPAAQRGQKIPDEKFHSSFGRQHTFHVQKTVVVEGQPRFQYGGYWFALSTPWPQGWAYTDDVYLDFIDGEYVLIDLLHPGMQLTIVVVG
jgi:hypothetical protein